ncbi:MAG: undecaprenyl-diphosphate phosphatase [Microgenomates group bacterium]
MDLLKAFILGIVEGLTEFLPISSTAHLLIAQKFLKIPQTEFTSFFDIVIQSGAILSVIFLYFKYLKENQYLIKKIFISFIPTAVIGFILHKIIKNYFFNSMNLIVGAMFFIGFLFVAFEIISQKKNNKVLSKMNYFEAIIIGLGQSLAIVPGVSRAGAVILTMLLLGFRRDEAAIYSFLLAVPTIMAASGLEIIKSDLRVIFIGNNFLSFLIGFFTSFFVALVVIKWFISFLKKKSLIFFGIYRMALAFYLFMI